MGDKLDSTINEVASRDRRVRAPSFDEEIEVVDTDEPIEVADIEEERCLKHSYNDTDSLSRPNTLQIDSVASTHTVHTREKSIHSQSSAAEGEFDECDDDASSSSQPELNIHREPSATESDPMNIWSARDDYALITAVAHTTCLQYVFKSLPFSRKFSKLDLEERYCQLMYDEKYSKQAMQRMNRMSAAEKLRVESRTPFTRFEEKVLMDAAKNLENEAKKNMGDFDLADAHRFLNLEDFQKILNDNKHLFHSSRTPQVLADHLRRIKQFGRVGKMIFTVDAFEQSNNRYANGLEVMRPLVDLRARHDAIARIPSLRGIQKGFLPTPIPDNAVGWIQGKFLQYAMTSNTAILGRSCLKEKVDCDLSKEGPALKISRQQAVITQLTKDVFTIKNIGQRAMFVDGKPLPQLVSTSLKNGSIIEVATLRVTFYIPVLRVLHPATRQYAMKLRKEEYDQRQKARGPPTGMMMSANPKFLPHGVKKPVPPRSLLKPPMPKKKEHPLEKLLGL